MLPLWFITFLAVQAGTPPPAPSTTSLADLHVVIAAPVYQPDGAVGTETATIANGSPSLVHLFGRKSLCETSTTGAKEPADAGFGWRVSVHTVTATPSAVVVSIEWRRLWDLGKKVNGPSGTVQLTLHAGDAIPLDLIPNTRTTDTCRAVAMGLEVRLTRSAAAPPINSALVPISATAGGVGSFNADLWLVHTMPSGVQQTQHQLIELRPSGAAFSFPPVKVAADTGDVNVAVNGSFVRYRGIDNGEFVLVSLTENFNDLGARAPMLGGNTNLLLSLPAVNDVTQLVMPPPFQSLRLSAPSAGGGGRGGGGVARSGGGGRGGGPTLGAGGAGAGTTGAGTTGAGSGGAAGSTAGAGARGGGRAGAGAVAMRTPAPEALATMTQRPTVDVASALQTMRALQGHTFAVSVKLTTR